MNDRCSGVGGCNCNNEAKWENEHGVKVCDYHKLLIDGFGWEHRHKRSWKQLNNKEQIVECAGFFYSAKHDMM